MVVCSPRDGCVCVFGGARARVLAVRLANAREHGRGGAGDARKAPGRAPARSGCPTAAERRRREDAIGRRARKKWWWCATLASQCRRPSIKDRGSRAENQGARIKGRGSRIEGRRPSSACRVSSVGHLALHQLPCLRRPAPLSGGTTSSRHALPHPPAHLCAESFIRVPVFLRGVPPACSIAALLASTPTTTPSR